MKKYIILAIITCVCMVAILFIGKNYFIRHPIKMFHPLTNFEKDYPFLHGIDSLICFSAGITWYETVDKVTGQKYLLTRSHDGTLYIAERTAYGGQKDWEIITPEQYKRKFNNGEEIGLLFK